MLTRPWKSQLLLWVLIAFGVVGCGRKNSDAGVWEAQVPLASMTFSLYEGGEAVINRGPTARRLITKWQIEPGFLVFTDQRFRIISREGDSMVLDFEKLGLVTFKRIAPLQAMPADFKTELQAEDTAYANQLTLRNNLRQIAAAADQYFLEHGKTSVTYDVLAPDYGLARYVKTVDGETYEGMVIEQGRPLRITTKSGLTVVYDNQ